MTAKNIKYMIAIKTNFSCGFYEIGHCFQCEIEGDKVTIDNEMCRWPETIPFVQFENEFKEMSKKDYDKYIELCEEGEDTKAVLKKYICF